MSAHVVGIDLFGGFRVTVDGRAVPDEDWRRRHAAALVKLLALSAGHRLHRERVAAALWPDAGLGEAAPRLHKAAHYARRVLGVPDAVVLAGDVVSLVPTGRVEVDTERFERLADAALAGRDPTAAGVAADACPGPLLPDDLYEEWTEEPRERLRLRRAEVLRLAGRWEELAAADPADEQAAVALARRLAAAGDRPAALRQFERLERALRQELGVGLSPEAARLRASLLATRAPSPGPDPGRGLVGRDDELVWVHRALGRVQQGRGRTLFVGGPAGVGKTSVLAAIERDAAAGGMRVGAGLAARVDGAWPYAPVLEALAGLCRRHPDLLEGLDEHMRGEIQRALAGRSSGWDGEAAHQRLFVAAAELLRLAAAGRGAVLLIDDAHEADEASLRLLHFLARATLTERVALVLGHRPVTVGALAEVRGSLLGRDGAATLDLKPLRSGDALVLARRHAPGVLPAAVQAVADASGGLPFAVVEGARAVAADPSSPVRRAFLPPGLPPEVLDPLAAAAVLGVGFDTDEFVELTGLRDDEAYGVLEAAVATGLLRRTDEGFAFAHALHREALLERQAEKGRRTAHLAAARALQNLGRSPGRIGRHLVQAGQPAAAVPWVLRAAETQAALGAYRDALALLDDVRDAAAGEEAVRLLALRADLLTACGDLGAVEAYRAALGAAHDPALRARLRTRLARTAAHSGDLETADLALAGLQPDGGSNDGDLLVARGMLALFRGDLSSASEAADEARGRIALGETEDSRLFDLITLQGLVAHHRGEWFQRLRAELRTGAEQPHVARSIYDSHLCVAEYLLYGPTPYDEVLHLAEQLRRTGERAGVPRAVAFAVALRGEAALLKGDLDLAAVELAAAAELHHGLEFPTGEAVCMERLAAVHLHRGDRAPARTLLQRALPLARWSMFSRCLLPRVYGTMIGASAEAEEAVAVVDRAEATLGPQERCFFCWIMLAVPAVRACAQAGELDRAQAWLAAAEAVQPRWEGTAWEASLTEVRGVLARAHGAEREAQRLLTTAAALFEGCGQPLDAARCRGEAQSTAAHGSPGRTAEPAVAGAVPYP